MYIRRRTSLPPRRLLREQQRPVDEPMRNRRLGVRNRTQAPELHVQQGPSDGRLTKRQRAQEKGALLGIAQRHHHRGRPRNLTSKRFGGLPPSILWNKSCDIVRGQMLRFLVNVPVYLLLAFRSAKRCCFLAARDCISSGRAWDLRTIPTLITN